MCEKTFDHLKYFRKITLTDHPESLLTLKACNRGFFTFFTSVYVVKISAPPKHRDKKYLNPQCIMEASESVDLHHLAWCLPTGIDI